MLDFFYRRVETIRMVVELRPHSSCHTSTPTTQLFKKCIAKVTKSQLTQSHTKIAKVSSNYINIFSCLTWWLMRFSLSSNQNTGQSRAPRSGPKKWLVFVWSSNDLVTSLIIQLLAFELHTCVSVVTINFSWWKNKPSSTTRASLRHFQIHHYGRIRSTSVCRTGTKLSITKSP